MTTNRPEFKAHDDFIFEHKKVGKVTREEFIKYIRSSHEHMRKLSELIQQYNQTIDDYLNEWDGRFESFDEDVKDLLGRWIQDGTMDHIINENLMSNKADKSYVDDLNENVTAQLAQTVDEVNKAVSEVTVDSEVILARGGETTLGVRLDESEERLDDSEERLDIIEEDVIVKATNSVKNGDFSNGMYGWTNHDASANAIASGAEIVSTGDNVYPRIYTNIENVPVGNVLYGAATYYFDDVSNIKHLRIQHHNHNFSGALVIKNNPAPKTLIRASGVTKVSTSASVAVVAIEIYDSKVPTTYQVGNILLIDLTETFGVGNEPTAEEMDKLLEQFPNSWFDGTVNIYNSKHMMTMFFKELTKLNNAITTLGGNV